MELNITGSRDLATLLRAVDPVLHPDEYVFCSFSNRRIPSGLSPLCSFQESEGLTLILERGEAERRDLPFVFPCRMITLKVHSALDAVGFLAAVSSALTEHGISANTISAYYHDHLFVPTARADDAMAAIRALARR